MFLAELIKELFVGTIKGIVTGVDKKKIEEEKRIEEEEKRRKEEEKKLENGGEKILESFMSDLIKAACEGLNEGLKDKK